MGHPSESVGLHRGAESGQLPQTRAQQDPQLQGRLKTSKTREFGWFRVWVTLAFRHLTKQTAVVKDLTSVPLFYLPSPPSLVHWCLHYCTLMFPLGNSGSWLKDPKLEKCALRVANDDMYCQTIAHFVLKIESLNQEVALDKSQMTEYVHLCSLSFYMCLQSGGQTGLLKTLK